MISDIKSSEFCESYESNGYEIDYSYQQNSYFGLVMALVIDKEYWILKLNKKWKLKFKSTDSSTSDWFGNEYKLGISVENPFDSNVSEITGLLKVLLIL